MSFDTFFEEVKEEFNYEEKKQEFIDNLDMLKLWITRINNQLRIGLYFED